MRTMSEGDAMASKLMIAGIPLLISVGGMIATLEMTARAADETEDRLRDVELKQAEDESTKVMVKQNTERLERLELMVLENARQLSKIQADMAAVCQATNARCR